MPMLKLVTVLMMMVLVKMVMRVMVLLLTTICCSRHDEYDAMNNFMRLSTNARAISYSRIFQSICLRQLALLIGVQEALHKCIDAIQSNMLSCFLSSNSYSQH